MTRKRFRADDDAVSPVIGVILMVAITVILAAVIGTFVLNLGGSVQTNVQAGASASQTANNEVQVTWTSNQNAKKLSVDVNTGGACSGTATLTSVGETFTTASACSSGDTATVVVTAISSDKSTVILNKEIEF